MEDNKAMEVAIAKAKSSAAKADRSAAAVKAMAKAVEERLWS